LRAPNAGNVLGIAPVAVYSTADEQAMQVERADESVRVDPPSARERHFDIASSPPAASSRARLRTCARGCD